MASAIKHFGHATMHIITVNQSSAMIFLLLIPLARQHWYYGSPAQYATVTRRIEKVRLCALYVYNIHKIMFVI